MAREFVEAAVGAYQAETCGYQRRSLASCACERPGAHVRAGAGACDGGCVDQVDTYRFVFPIDAESFEPLGTVVLACPAFGRLDIANTLQVGHEFERSGRASGSDGWAGFWRGDDGEVAHDGRGGVDTVDAQIDGRNLGVEHMVFGDEDGGNATFHSGNQGVAQLGQHVLADAFGGEEIDRSFTQWRLLQGDADGLVCRGLRGIPEDIHPGLQQCNSGAYFQAI